MAVGVLLFLGVFQAHADEWRATGQARVIEGDSLWLLHPVQVFCLDPVTCGASNIVHPVGIEIRFHGIDAFELHQTCTGEDGKLWHCGYASQAYLTEIIQDHPVTCFGGGPGQGQDPYGRKIAVCYRRDKNLNEAMIRRGLALALRRNSEAYVEAKEWAHYVEAENWAHAQRAGVWAGTFVPPWDWRRGVRH